MQPVNNMTPLKEIKKQIKKEYGTKCKDYSPLCTVCIAYNAIETLEILLDKPKK
jgi:hypothetical protein